MSSRNINLWMRNNERMLGYTTCYIQVSCFVQLTSRCLLYTCYILQKTCYIHISYLNKVLVNPGFGNFEVSGFEDVPPSETSRILVDVTLWTPRVAKSHRFRDDHVLLGFSGARASPSNNSSNSTQMYCNLSP